VIDHQCAPLQRYEQRQINNYNIEVNLDKFDPKLDPKEWNNHTLKGADAKNEETIELRSKQIKKMKTERLRKFYEEIMTDIVTYSKSE